MTSRVIEGFGVGKRVVGAMLGTVEGMDVGADVMKTAQAHTK